jgi:hypothetical protein
VLIDSQALSLDDDISEEHITSLHGVEHHVKLPCRVYHPYEPNAAFEGRDDILKELTLALLPSPGSQTTRKVFALSGLGGIGKTQTALKFMFENMDQFEAVCWVPTSDMSKVIERYMEFAVDLHLVKDMNADPQEAIMKLTNWLKHTSKSSL